MYNNDTKHDRCVFNKNIPMNYNILHLFLVDYY